MPDSATMKSVMQRYVDLVSAWDAAAVADLFADDATVEDPVGTPVLQGKAAIRHFYQEAVKTGCKLELVAPIRGSQGNSAAMAFNVKIPTATIRVIDVMTFDEAGKISSMRAFWGPDDYIPG